MRIKEFSRKDFINLFSGTLVASGLGLIGFNLFGTGDGEPKAANAPTPGSFSVPSISDEQATAADRAAGGPKDKTLKLTVPKMSRVENGNVPNAVGSNSKALNNNTAIHLKGTGFPWQEGANTYIAGHRMGYPGTDSFLAFYDQNVLEKGDAIYVTDAEGTRYTYKVFKNFVVETDDLRVTQPVKGKSVVTLQTCTLPNYTNRLITQAELVEVKKA